MEGQPPQARSSRVTGDGEGLFPGTGEKQEGVLTGRSGQLTVQDDHPKGFTEVPDFSNMRGSVLHEPLVGQEGMCAYPPLFEISSQGSDVQGDEVLAGNPGKGTSQPHHVRTGLFHAADILG